MLKLHHYGFLTNDIESSSKEHSFLGYKKISQPIIDNNRNIKISFLKHPSSDILLELIQPLNEKSIVNNLIKKYQNNLYHSCYKVDNIEQYNNYLQSNGFLMIDPPKPAIAFNNSRVAFLYSSFCGIIEILEKNA